MAAARAGGGAGLAGAGAGMAAFGGGGGGATATFFLHPAASKVTAAISNEHSFLRVVHIDPFPIYD